MLARLSRQDRFELICVPHPTSARDGHSPRALPPLALSDVSVLFPRYLFDKCTNSIIASQ